MNETLMSSITQFAVFNHVLLLLLLFITILFQIFHKLLDIFLLINNFLFERLIFFVHVMISFLFQLFIVEYIFRGRRVRTCCWPSSVRLAEHWWSLSYLIVGALYCTCIHHDAFFKVSKFLFVVNLFHKVDFFWRKEALSEAQT